MEVPKLCCALMFLSILSFGHGQLACTLKDIKVDQHGTGVWIHGKPEFEVTVSNDCICSQEDLKLNCTGFQSTEGIDPAVFRQDSDSCLINDGQPVHMSENISFKYAWDTKFALVPLYSSIACS